MSIGVLQALSDRHRQQKRWLDEAPRLGKIDARKGEFLGTLPAPDIQEHNRAKTNDPLYSIRAISTKTKDPEGIGVVLDGTPHLLRAPASYDKMREITLELVSRGVHPADITVWEYDPATNKIVEIRSALDHLLWTIGDQMRLEEKEAEAKP